MECKGASARFGPAFGGSRQTAEAPEPLPAKLSAFLEIKSFYTMI
jgi:hypothetical protein